MLFLVLCYLIGGSFFSGYVLGTLDKEETPVFEMASMVMIWALIWPYWISRALWRGFRAAQKKGQP